MLSKRKYRMGRRTSFLCCFRFDVRIEYPKIAESQIGFRLFVQAVHGNGKRGSDVEGSIGVPGAVPPIVRGAHAGVVVGGSVEVYRVVFLRILRELETVHGSGFRIERDGRFPVDKESVDGNERVEGEEDDEDYDGSCHGFKS